VLVDGAVAAEFPVTTTESDELLAHLGLLAHPAPRRALIVNALPGGLLAEVLKHPVESVTCVTLDPGVLRAAVRAGGDAVEALLADPRVSVETADPPQFLRRGAERYDCIILPAGAPQSLGANRLATVEFYRLCRARLSTDGVLAVRGPSLPVADRIALAGLEARRAALARAFGTVQLVPCAPSVLLASAAAAAPLLTADSARSRLAARGIRTLTLVVQLGRLDENLATPDTALPALPPNTIAHPSERFTALLAGLERSAPALARAWLQLRLRAWPVLVAGMAFASATFLFGRRRRRLAVRAALVSSGFAGSGIALLNLFVLQAVSGAAYSGVILLFAAFTAGNAAGAWWGNLIATRVAHRHFIGAEFALALTALLLAPAARGAPQTIFPALAALAGACLGLQFAVASRADPDRAPARRTGPLAALDLVGGVLGALLLPVFVVPAFGLAAAGAGIAVAKLATAMALVLPPGRD
jgi:spermidine synthase